MMGDPVSPGKAALRRHVEMEEWENVDAISVGTEGELKRELAEIGGLCADVKNPEWVKRVTALQRFRGLLVGGAGDFPGFVQLMRDHMREPLNQAIQDLRSAVAKEACWAVMMLCKALPDKTWESIGDWFLSSLFKIAIITIAIISHSSSRCLRYIFNNCSLSVRMRGVILEPCNFENKHSTYRQRVYRAIFTMVHRVESSEFTDREIDLLVRAIARGLCDPMPEIRRVSRFLYWAFVRIEPARAQALLDGQDPATQRQVADDRETYDTMDLQEIDIDVENSKPFSRAGGTRRRLQHKVDDDSTAAQRSATVGPASTTPTRRSGQRSTTPLPRRASRERLRGAHPVRPPPDDAIDTPQRAQGSRSPLVRRRTDSNAARPRDSSDGATQDTPELSSCASVSSLKRSQHGDVPSIDKALALAASADWADRVRCFESIVSAAGPAGVPLQTLLDRVDSVMTTLIDKLQDNHFRVVHAALQCALAILNRTAAAGEEYQLFTHLERLYAGAFGRLAPPGKDAVRKAAQDLLERLIEVYPPARVFPVLTKVLDHTRVQLAALEYIWHLLKLKRPSCTEYLSSMSNMRPSLQKFITHGSSANAEVRRAGLHCLHCLYCTQPLAFCQAVLAGSPSDQQQVRSLLAKQVPSLGEELQLLRTQGQPAVERLLRSRHHDDSGGVLESPKVLAHADSIRSAVSSGVRRGRHADPTDDQPTTPLRRATSGSRSQLRRGSTQHQDRAATAELAWEILADAGSSPDSKAERASWLVNEWCGSRAPWPSEQMSQRLCDSNPSGPRLLELALDPRTSCNLRCDSLRLAGRLCPAGDRARRVRFLRDLVRLYLDPDRNVSRAAEDTLAFVASLIPAQDAVPLLGQLIDSIIKGNYFREAGYHSDDLLPWLLKTFEERLRSMGQSFPADDVLTALDEFLPGLYDGFSSQRAEVRKAVVFCFVSLYMTLGPQAVPALRPLTPNQLKLVTIYVNRRQSLAGMQQPSDLSDLSGLVAASDRRSD